MSIEFPRDARVRFTQERLAVLTPRDRQGLAGRIGVVQTDSDLVRKPTVYFPKDGAMLELRLFRVDPRHLELVEGPPETEVAPRLNSDTVDKVTADAGEGGNLSQSDLDNFFD
jgi:hypothetical protein